MSAAAEEAESLEIQPWERYTDLDRIKYAGALFISLLGCVVGFTFELWPVLIISFVCVWAVDRKGRDVYRSFRRRIRLKR